MSIKPYLYPRCGKSTKSTSGLTNYLNTCKGQIYPKSLRDISLDYYNKEDISSENLEDYKSDLLGKTNNNATANGIFEKSIGHTPCKKVLVSEFLLAWRKEWFSNHDFPIGTPILDKKYRHWDQNTRIVPTSSIISKTMLQLIILQIEKLSKAIRTSFILIY